ncbi:MAG: uracil phosphoribosyltransferase, partial [Desulfovibrionaceae bacterium]
MGFQVVDHPLIRHKVGLLRENGISTSQFRALSTEVTRLLVYEATKDLATQPATIQG